ncbi:MAG: DUF1993 domain-containing protein [Asticcacaulis sp.]
MSTDTMTKFDMYQAAIPASLRVLNNLKAILQKAEAWASEKTVDPSVVLNARLALDMFPLVRQVQIVTDTAKGIAGRLTGIEVPSYEDNETTFAELYARLDKTIAFVNSVKPEQFDGAETREVVITFRGNSTHYTGLNFLTVRALPNLFFHMTTAYAILRHSGVPVGKADFLGPQS